MSISAWRGGAIALLSLASLLSGCAEQPMRAPDAFRLTRLFPLEHDTTPVFDDVITASPLLYGKDGARQVLLPVSNGEVAAIDALSGALRWRVTMPCPHELKAVIAATPVIVAPRLFVAYQCTDGVTGRKHHFLAALDLPRQRLDENWPVIELQAELPSSDGRGTVQFDPPHAFSRAALQHTVPVGSELGYVYVAFGNAGDVQPYHGWLFEIDLDAWQRGEMGRVTRAVMTTTPEQECPVTQPYGTREMICAGGIWTPAGPLVDERGTRSTLFVPTGNGQVDLKRRDYGNALLRIEPGLVFDPGCDEALCRDFNPSDPSFACLASCRHLFIPRPAPDDPPLRPADGECDERTFWDCLAWMDYDLGANTPVNITLDDGRTVLVQPGKEGGVYLIDADHLGRQYDRLQIVNVCGTPQDECKLHWRGMIVTQPVATHVNGDPIVVVPTFMSDTSQPAGLIALKIVLVEGQPKLQRFWQVPDPHSPEAVKTFRAHPSYPLLHHWQGKEPYVWVVDVGNPGDIYGVRVRDGRRVAHALLKGTGRPLARLLLDGDRLYVTSNAPGKKTAWLEAYRIEAVD